MFTDIFTSDYTYGVSYPFLCAYHSQLYSEY